MLFGMKSAADPDIRLLQAAADPTRLAILRQLSGAGAVCACDFTACCDVAQPTVSHHLKVLREAGWVTTERRGSWVDYTLNPVAVARFRDVAAGLSPLAAPRLGTPGEGPGAGSRRSPVSRLDRR